MCKVGVRTCIFLFCFDFFSHCEKKTEEGLVESFSHAFCFSYPGHHSCLCVWTYPRFLQSNPSVCLLVSPWAVQHGRAVPVSLSPMGSCACVGLSKLQRTLLKPAVGEGQQSVMVRKCSHCPIIWWSQFMLSSSVLRNILHPKSCGAPGATFGAALGSSVWVPSAFPGCSGELQRAGLPPQPLLRSPPSPALGAPPLPLPRRCGKRHRK